MSHYPRDMNGYGRLGLDPKWPDNANIAVQFVINYEEGGENNILHGDKASEAFLSEIVGAAPWQGQRHWNMETIYEYGARQGFWRLHRLFTELDIPATVYGVATALARAPEQVAAMQEADWEIASHGLKWIEYKDHSIENELADMKQAIALHEEVTGASPKGWYTGRCSVNTVDLITQLGSLSYVSDSYADDLPYWHHYDGKNQLIVPYTLDANDMRFATPQGFNSGDQFYNYLKDSFDVLYAEGEQGQAKMMSIGLHCRLIGRPGRVMALRRFMEYVKSHDKVWFAKRIEIADHWHKHFPAPEIAKKASHMDRQNFVETFGGVFEHSEWIAERAYDDEIAAVNDTPEGLHAVLVRKFRSSTPDEKRSVLKAHPDLAGKLAKAKQLTPQSTIEQASAGLDSLSPDESNEFTKLNQDYVQKFDFPFIIAVKGLNKSQILSQFKVRIDNDSETEFQTACSEVEKIARLRLDDML